MVVAGGEALSQRGAVARRAFLAKATTTATAAAIIAATPATAADKYSLDVEETYQTKKEVTEKKSGNGGVIVGAALGGGLLLSFPFFAPNVARLAGYKMHS